ncbi:MAG TPA: hypothetical protein VKB62_07215, partial [Streptosporangiaceae bacterium]|nr:hypothetical protein [Streptosporangiaceae bacterium]
MRRRALWALVASAAVAAAGIAVTASPVAAATSGIWGNAQEIAGLSQLNVGLFAELNSVSCSSPGECGAGGTYTDAIGPQALVVSEHDGAWSTPQKVPGTAALNAGGWAEVTSVSCASPGNCTAGGYYTDAGNSRQAFVVTETGGTWGTAEEVPGTAALNAGPDAEVTSVSCASPGNCSAGGFYTDANNLQPGFVADETSGTWGTAQQVSGAGAVAAVSCVTPGDCSAGGNSGSPGFVASETGGIWGPAEALPGTSVNSLSCVSPGNCAAG